MSQQTDLTGLNEKKDSSPTPNSPAHNVQSTSSGICIKQEYFEDQLLMTRIIKTESEFFQDQLPVTVKTEAESPPNQHNIMDSIKVEVKEEYYDDQDCVVKCELDFDEGEQINRKIKVEDVSSGQLVQNFKCVKKEEEEDVGEYVMECDCEECEICRVKREIKEELDESGETELGGNNVETVQGCTRVKKEEGDDDGEVERPYKIRRMNRVVRNVPVGALSRNVIPINVECIDDQMATSSTNSFTIEDHTQASQSVTFPLPTQIVTPTQSSSSSANHVNEQLRDESLNAEPWMDNVAHVGDVDAEEFDRQQVDEHNSTLNPVHTNQDGEEAEVEDDKNIGEQDDEDEGDESIEQLQDTNAGDGQQVPTENFVKRIDPTDELGNKFECDYRGCGRRMKQQWNLIRHIRSHTGEKPFKCSVEGCDRAFVRDAQLKEHLNTHSGSRPFVCTWLRCDARFGNKGNLNAHTRTHTGELPFECDQCDATFIHHSHLVTHLRIHTGVRPFMCTWPHCGQAFISSSHLHSHSRVHSNESQFVCDVTGCTKVYKRKDVLRRHQMKKHN